MLILVGKHSPGARDRQHLTSIETWKMLPTYHSSSECREDQHAALREWNQSCIRTYLCVLDIMSRAAAAAAVWASYTNHQWSYTGHTYGAGSANDAHAPAQHPRLWTSLARRSGFILTLVSEFATMRAIARNPGYRIWAARCPIAHVWTAKTQSLDASRGSTSATCVEVQNHTPRVRVLPSRGLLTMEGCHRVRRCQCLVSFELELVGL